MPRHAIKQVDRLLSNTELDRESLFCCWVSFVVAERREIVVLEMQSGHSRSTPVLWKTVRRSALKDLRNDDEDELLVLLSTVVPKGVGVTVVADRSFADSKLFVFLTEELGFDYLIRLHSNIYVEAASKEVRKAAEWVGQGGGRMRLLRKVRITAQRTEVPVFVCVREKAMRDVWCLVSSRSDWTGSEIKRSYAKRFSVEESFRDLKNPRLGLGLKQTKITRNDRRDMLLLLASLAHALLTLLGKAGQQLGMERWLGATKPGGISPFRQGLLLWDLLPRMREDRLRALMSRFGELLRQHVLFTGILGVL